MPNYQTEYTKAALDALAEWLFILPTDVQRKLKLARSVIETHGEATGEELRRELGDNWVLARRTKGIVERYGPNVKCYSAKQYADAERRAIESREL